MRTTGIVTAIIIMVAMGCLGGCKPLTRTQQLENENAELKTQLQRLADLLEQANAKEENQQEALKKYHEKVVQLEKENFEFQNAMTKLRKQMEFHRNRALQLEARNERLSDLLEQREKEIKSLGRQLKQRRSQVSPPVGP